MKHFDHGIGGFSPSAVASSSLPFISFKSDQEDSVWGDYTLDLSFLSSDDQRSARDDDDSLSNLSRDVDTTKEGDVLINPDPLLSKLPEQCSIVTAGADKLDLSCAKTTVVSEKSSAHSDPEEDSPCWIGLLSLKNLDSAAKSVTSRRSTDDLSGTYRLNPLAPQFIPSISKKKHDTDAAGKRDGDEANSSSLKKSLSSNFPSSSGEFSIANSLEDGKNDAARGKHILTNNADENFGFLPQDMVSMSVDILDSGNELQTPKRLDPLAPVFVPASAKLSPSLHEKQGAFDTTRHSTSTLTSSDIKSLTNFKVEACSGKVGRGVKIRYPDGVTDIGSTSSFNPSIESKAGISEYAKLGSFNNKPHGQRKLNPLAPQFSLADTKPKPYGYDKDQARDGFFVSSPLISYKEDTVVDAGLAQSSVYVERRLSNMSRGNSSLISFKTDGNLESPSNVEAFSGYGQRHSFSASSSSPKLDVKKLLTTMHGLSELLTLANGLESSDSLNAQELDLINSTVQNLNSYSKSNSQKHAGNQSVIRHSSYDLKMLPNKNKLSIRDLQLPRANNVTVDLDVKRKEKYPMVSAETVPDSRLYEYVGTQDDGLGQVVAASGYQQNYQGVEQINQHALFYKGLWLKAEADRCLMVYETSLSNPSS